MAAPDEPAALAVDPELPAFCVDEDLDVIETPTSPSSACCSSRFEFETGRGNEGTKILMVEWDPNAGSQSQDQAKVQDAAAERSSSSWKRHWEVSWEGKGQIWAVRDSASNEDLLRVYYLLPPNAPVPALVTIKKLGDAACVLRTQPWPWIYVAELTGGLPLEAGRRGVLHTLWAKNWLAELDAEIAAEMKTNVESVGLEMALRDRQVIVELFGLPQAEGLPHAQCSVLSQAPPSPSTPRSPVGGRLGEKLRGLKLATSPVELAAASQVAKSAHVQSQEQARTSGPTISSFGGRPAGDGRLASLDAIVGGDVRPPAVREDTTEEDLFALPMSPRSPEMKKSPFSLL